MSQLPSELKYAKSHEWVRDEGDGNVTVGITDHAQGLLGDLVFVELPEEGVVFAAGDEAGVVESVKAASDICCTSSNAAQIVAAMDSDTVIMTPDQYLAQNVARDVPQKNVVWWEGSCIVHEQFTAEELRADNTTDQHRRRSDQRVNNRFVRHKPKYQKTQR